MFGLKGPVLIVKFWESCETLLKMPTSYSIGSITRIQLYPVVAFPPLASPGRQFRAGSAIDGSLKMTTGYRLLMLS